MLVMLFMRINPSSKKFGNSVFLGNEHIKTQKWLQFSGKIFNNKIRAFGQNQFVFNKSENWKENNKLFKFSIHVAVFMSKNFGSWPLIINSKNGSILSCLSLPNNSTSST